MKMFIQRITIQTSRRPKTQSVNEQLQWLGSTLGLFGERDRNKSCFRLFIELIKAAKNNEQLTSEELAERLGLTRATIVHHLNTLMERGIVIHQTSMYIMREERLTALIEDIERDVQRSLEEIKKSAEELDKILDL